MTPGQAYFTPATPPHGAWPLQTLHLSMRKSCSDNRDQFSLERAGRFTEDVTAEAPRVRRINMSATNVARE
jgi:hypothetical protein